SEGDAIIAARPLGQLIEPRVLDLDRIAEDMNQAVRNLTVRSENQIGQVSADRAIMQGAPVIAGTRIPTATIDWLHRNGYSEEEILVDFPRLRSEDVRAAIEYEAKRRREASQPIPAAG